MQNSGLLRVFDDDEPIEQKYRFAKIFVLEPVEWSRLMEDCGQRMGLVEGRKPRSKTKVFLFKICRALIKICRARMSVG